MIPAAVVKDVPGEFLEAFALGVYAGTALLIVLSAIMVVS